MMLRRRGIDFESHLVSQDLAVQRARVGDRPRHSDRRRADASATRIATFR